MKMYLPEISLGQNHIFCTNYKAKACSVSTRNSIRSSSIHNSFVFAMLVYICMESHEVIAVKAVNVFGQNRV